MFDHLQGENVENYTCPVVDCPARNFFQDARVARLIRHALNNTYWSEKTQWQKKALKFKKIKNQVQYRQCAWLQRKVIRTKLSTRTFPALLTFLLTSFYD